MIAAALVLGGILALLARHLSPPRGYSADRERDSELRGMATACFLAALLIGVAGWLW